MDVNEQIICLLETVWFHAFHLFRVLAHLSLSLSSLLRPTRASDAWTPCAVSQRGKTPAHGWAGWWSE